MSIEFSKHDTEFSQKLVNEILNYCKSRIGAKRFNRIVYDVIEKKIRKTLKHKIICYDFDIKISTNYAAGIKLDVAYNSVDYHISIFYTRSGFVGDILTEYYHSIESAMMCKKEKFMRYNARRLKMILESLFPGFKFPDPDIYKDLYGEIDLRAGGKREHVKYTRDAILKSSKVIGDVLYIKRHDALLFVTKREDVFYGAILGDAIKSGYNQVFKNLTISEQDLAKLVSTIINRDFNYVLNNLGNPLIIENLRKCAILNSL